MVRGALEIISPEGIVYGGVDESNHGYFPEYFSLVLSGKDEDTVKSNLKIGKAKTNQNLKKNFNKVLKRGHTFLQVEKRDYESIIPKKFIGCVIASLAEEFLPPELDLFKLFIDGKLESYRRLYARDLLSDIYGFSKKQIIIQSGGAYDQRYPIVNMADGVARYYFKEFSAQKLSKNPRRRELQYFD